MPLPAWLAQFNRRITNRITRPFAGWLPGFAVVTHRGRHSGHLYRTPVNLFRFRDSFVIALTYGRDRDWVKNVLAAGRCHVVTRGQTLLLTGPRIVKDVDRALVPAPVRPILKALGVSEFMELRESGRTSGRAGSGAE